MPIAYYPTFLRYHLPGTTDFNFFHFWWRMMTVGPWPSGQSWFLWVLLAFDVIAVAIWVAAPRMLRMFGRLIFAASRPAGDGLCGLPGHLGRGPICRCMLVFGDVSWLEPGRYPFPIQTSRILLYPAYFFTGVGIGVVGLSAGHRR